MGIEYIDKTHAKLVLTRGSGSNRERRVKRITYTNKRDAKRQWEEFIQTSGFGVNTKITVEQLLSQYVAQAEWNGRKPTTIRGYRISKNRITSSIGKRRASEITLSDIDQFIQEEARKFSPKTIKNDVSLLNASYKYAIRRGILESNPCEYAIIPRQTKSQISVLSDADISRFTAALENESLDFKVLCELALFCGLRRSEIVGLLKSDVSDTVTISKVRNRLDGTDVIETPKTISSIRTIAVPKFLQDDIQRLIEDQSSRPAQSEYLILDSFGEPINPNWASDHMKDFLARNDLPHVTIHGLRHTCASMLISKGIPIPEVSAQLGHASVDITLRVYTHLFTDASTASKRISDLMDGIMAPNGHQNL